MIVPVSAAHAALSATVGPSARRAGTQDASVADGRSTTGNQGERQGMGWRDAEHVTPKSSRRSHK